LLQASELGSGGIESSIAVKDGVGYFGHLDGHVRALRLKDQQLLWATKIGGDTDASPMIHDGRLFIGSQAGRDSFRCLDVATGKILWTAAINGGIWSSAAHLDGRIYVGGNNHNMYCLDEKTGKLIPPQRIVPEKYMAASKSGLTATIDSAHRTVALDLAP
jgi:outer membrane protein assembly factor BamB